MDGEQRTGTADLASASAARSNLAASREEARAKPAAECVARTAARAASTCIFTSVFIAIAVGVFWWAHRFNPMAAELMRNSALQNLLG